MTFGVATFDTSTFRSLFTVCLDTTVGPGFHEIVNVVDTINYNGRRFTKRAASHGANNHPGTVVGGSSVVFNFANLTGNVLSYYPYTGSNGQCLTHSLVMYADNDTI